MEFLGKTSHMTQGDLPEAEKRIRFNGFYPNICDPDEVERLEQEPEHLDRVFKELMSEQLTRWLAISQERLEPQGVPCFVMPGNADDFFIVDDLKPTPFLSHPHLHSHPHAP